MSRLRLRQCAIVHFVRRQEINEKALGVIGMIKRVRGFILLNERSSLSAIQQVNR